MGYRIQYRRDTASRWAEINPILLEGEIGYVTDSPNQYKMGDGVHRWNDLPLSGFNGTIAPTLGYDDNAVLSQRIVTEKFEEHNEKITELGSIVCLYPISNDENVNLYIKELYLENLNEAKRYYVKDIKTYETNGVVRKTFVVYDDTPRAVAQMDRAITDKDIASVFSLNGSGIKGYVVDSITEGIDVDGDDTMALNHLLVGNLKFSPAISQYLNNLEYAKMLDDNVERIENEYNPNVVTDKKEVNRVIQEIYLKGASNDKEYDIRSMLVYNGRKTFVVAEVNGTAVAQMDRPLSDNGVVPIFELNNSGVSGYAVCDFPTELDIQPYAVLNKGVYSSIEQNPSIAFYLREDKGILKVSDNAEYGVKTGSKTGFNNDFRIITNLVESDIDGVLSKINMLSNLSGIAFFGVGFVDQNNKAIINKIFSVSVSNGDNAIDVLSLGIKVNKGDILFGLPYYSGGEASVFTFTASTTDKGYKSRLNFATSIGGKLFTYQSIGGGAYSYANFAYEVKSIESPFADKGSIEKLGDEVSNVSAMASKALSNSFKVKDRFGNTYKMIVVNGSISVIPQEFKNIAVIGNSITSHSRSEGVNWLTSGYGMAASTPNTDFSAFILEACLKKNSEAVLIRKNLATWESGLQLTESIKNTINDLVSNRDLVVLKIGENVSSTASNFQSAFAELVNYIISVNPNAEIVICSLFWADAKKDEAMRNVANSLSLPYCIGAMTESEQMEELGHYLKSTDGSYFEVTNNGVKMHPSDIGMLMIANSILESLDIQKLEKLHNIIIDANNADCQCYSKGVESGIVTITSSQQPIVTSASGTSISTTHVAEGKYVFTMPNEDVSVTF